MGIPLALGFAFGSQRAGVGIFMDLPASLAFWVLASFSAWVTNDIGSRVAASLFRPLGLPLWSALFAGVVMGHFLNIATWQWRMSLFVTDEQLRMIAIPVPALSVAYAIFMVRSLVVGVVLWLGANYLMLLVWGAPRYGYFPPSANAGETERTGPPEASEGVEIIDPDGIIAAQAQQHYVILHRDRGRQTIQMRLSDAERLLGPHRGIRVHRSFWVARCAILSIQKDGQATRLHMSNGMFVPVGRTYLLKVRELQKT